MLKFHKNGIPEAARMFAGHIKSAVFAVGMLSGVLISPVASATTYYVSVAGNDSYSATQAQSTITPWKTIQHAASNMSPGDTCSIKAGIYREIQAVIPPNNTTFQAYGDGKAIISGTDTLPVSGQSWTLETSNIWYTPVNWTLGDGNQVFQNSVMKNEARWPNNSEVWQGSRPATPSSNTYTDTWSYLDSAGYDAQGHNGWFIDAALPSNINWAGCTVHIMQGYGWIMMHPIITGYDNTTHKLTTNDNNKYDSQGNISAYAFTAGNEYYVTGSKELMDNDGEWFYDSLNSRLYFYSSSGMPSNVEFKRRSCGFNLSGKSFIRLVNLDFFGCTVQTDSGSTDCTFDGLNMQYLNHSRIASSYGGITLRDRGVLRNSELAFDSTGLIVLCGNDIRVINNHLHDSGYVPTWTEIIGGDGSRNLISHNTLHDSGRPLLGFLGKAAICEYNNMYNAMKLTSDGGILHTKMDAGNAIFKYNMLHDSFGPNGHLGAAVQGFYLDCFNDNWIVHHNIIWNVSGYAMQINNRQNFNMIFNNTCWGAVQGSLAAGFPSDGESGTRIFNNIFIPNRQPVGIDADIRYNLYSDPLFVDLGNLNFQLMPTSPAIDKGTVIPGVTDNYTGNAPDMGAMEYGGTDWTVSCGHNFTTPPSPDPAYNFPSIIFCNKVIDGGFESNSLSPNWTATGSVILVYQNSWSWDSSTCTRSGFYSAKLSSSGSEINQTINNLQPGRRYMLFAAVKKMNAGDAITIGVRNYGRSSVETSASATDTNWHMYSQPFVTGSSTTSAQAYIHAATVANAAYVDDVGIELYAVESAQPPLPAVHYSFNENSGFIAHDSAHGLNGTLNGNMTDADWVSGKFGNALDFDGINDYVDCGNDTSLQLTGDLTLSFWIKPTNVGSARINPLDKNYSGEFALTIETDGSLSYYHHTALSPYYWGWTSLPAKTIQNGVWQHIVVTRDSVTQTMKCYYNGVLKNTMSYAGSSPTVSASSVKIGSGYSHAIAGQMDDVRIYNCVLTCDMVTCLFSFDPAKVLHLMFDESSGATTAWDCSENGNNGTLTNMTPISDWVDGIINGALDFDGINDYVDCGNDTSLQLTGDLTLSFWIKPTNVGSARINPLDKNYSGEFALTIETDGSLSYYHHTALSPYYWGWTSLPAGTIQNGVWQHIVVTRDSVTQTMKCYYNGVLKNTMSYAGSSPAVSASSVKIGSGYSHAIAGQMDDVRIYSRSLDWQEILDIAFMRDDGPYGGF